MIYIAVVLILFTHYCAFTLGRFLGTKEGIDYCFKKQEEEIQKHI